MKKRVLIFFITLCLVCIIGAVFTACKQTEFTLKFVVDDAEYAMVSTSGNETIKMPNNPTKDGYIFDGWFWDDGTWQRPFTAKSLLNEPLTSNMSVYAKFVSDKQSEYKGVYQDIVKAIKTYAQTKNTLSDGVSYIFTGNAGNASDFSFQFALLYNEPYDSDAYIGVELIIKKDGDYHATLMYTFEQNQNDSVKGVYTDYATKSKGYFTFIPSEYYNNTNVSFNRFVWGNGYSELEYSETPYKLVYESGASVYTQTGISLFDKFLKEEFSYGMEKLGFVNMRKAKTADPISTIYCKSSLTIKQGQTVEVPYVTFPFYNRGDETLTSSDNSVVTVSGSNMTAVNTGSTTVTVRAGSVSKSVSVTVDSMTNADIVRKFLNDNSEAYFDAKGNKLSSVPSQGLYYKLVTLPDGGGGTTFSIACKRGDSQPTRLETHDLTLYFNLPNDGNVITQIYNTASALYTYYVDSNHVDVTHLNDFEVTSKGELNFKFTKTSYMESLDPYDAITVLNNMQSTATKTIEVLGIIVSKNSNGYLDANKTSYFDLTLNNTTATTATFDCEFSQYYGERIKSAKLYQNGSLIDDCIDKFSADYMLSDLSSNTSYSLEVIFAYDKNDGNGEQTVVRTVNFTTKIANGTPCTVTYNANGGKVETNTQTLQYNNYYNLFIPTRTGHNFDGWYCNDELVENSGTWTLGLNVTLVAKWYVATYNIRYGNVSGATNNNPATYTFGTSVSVSNPSKTGYTFLGWTTSDSAEPVKNYAITSSDTGDLQLTARWQANEYTVIFECNGADEELSPIQIEYDAWFALPSISRVGYTFNGWYNASVKMSDGYYKTAQNITLSARWTANKNTPYSVEVYQQNINDDEYTLFKTTNLTGTSDSDVSPSVETYTGFTTPARQTVNLSADGSLVVKYYYLRNSYILNYVTNGGIAMEYTSHKYESALNLADAVRDNFTFGGWYTDVRLANAVADTTMPAQNITVYAWWTEETKSGDFSYSGTNSITVSKYNGASTSVRIPSFIGDVTVTTIGSSAFQNNTNVTSVTLNGSIVSIGNYAFSGCSALTQFNSDNVNEIVVPNKVETIGQYAFQNIALVTKVIVPNSVISIGEGAFKGCNALEDITLPFVGANATATGGKDSVLGHIFGYDSMKGSDVMKYKTSSGKTYQGDDNNWYYTYHFIPATLKEVTIISQTSISANAFRNCDLIEKITIPENVTSIGSCAFYNCHALKQLNSNADGEFNIPTGVTAISDNSFYANKLATKVTLGQDVTSIGQYAFSNCSALTQFNSDNANELVVPNKVETIGQYAFQNIALVTKIVVADSVTSIGIGAFKGCNALEDITLPFVGTNATASSETSRVFGYIFGYDSSNSSSNWKTSGGNGTYQGNSNIYYFVPTTLKKVTITVQTEIPANAFYNCDLIEYATIPANVTSIGRYAFFNCYALKRLNSEIDGECNIPSGLTEINEYAFFCNRNISKVIILGTLTTIQGHAFRGCSALNNINVTADMTIASTSFSDCLMTTKTGVCYVGEVLYIYNGTMPSGYVLNVKPGTVSIYANALKGQTGLTKVILPESVTAIGNSAFEDCTALAEITQTKSIQALGQRSFYSCKLLTGIDIADVTAVPQYAFYGCVALQEISLPNVVTIADRAFSGCSALSKFNSDVEGQLILPECCTSIGQYAFADCTALTDVDLANATYASSALAHCPSLAKLTVANVDTYLGVIFGTTSVSGSYAARQNTTTYYIPSTLTELVITAQSSNKIANYAFANCKSLVKVTLPNNVTDLGEYAFNGCVALQQVVLPTELNTIGQYCFNGCTALTDADLSVCSLQTINAYAFQNCSALNSVYINSSVTFIGEYVFNGCTNLTISCQVAEYPSDWDYNWNPSNCTVNWGAKNV